MLKLGCIILFFLSSYLVFSQTPFFKKYSKESKFPTDIVYDIYQDNNGFIWVGCEEGLIKFDGKQTKLFSTNKSSGKAVSNILETNDGTIWCQNFSGHFFYVERDSLIFKEEISTYGYYMPAGLINGEILCCYSKKSIILYNSATSKIISKISLDVKNYFPNVNSVSSEYYLFSGINKQKVSINANGITTFYDLKNVSENSFFYTVFNKNDLFLSKAKPIVLNYSKNNLKKDLSKYFENRILNNVECFGSDKIALLTSSGFCFLNEKLELSDFYFNEERISSLLQDDEGNIWVGTLKNGLYFVPNLEVKKYLNDVYINKTFFGKEGLLVGTSENELFSLNLKTGSKILIYKDSAKHEVKSMFQNSHNKDVLFCSDKFYHISSKGEKMHSDVISVNQIDQLDSTHYLLSESGTLSIYPITLNDHWLSWLNDSTRILTNKRLSLNLEYVRVKSSLVINDTIFSATSEGLYRHSKQSSTKIHFNKKEIECFELAKISDTLIILTANNEILMYNKGIVKPFISAKQGMSSNELFALKVFEKKIYVLNTHGIEVFNSKGKKIKQYNRSDGFLNIDVTDFVVNNGNLIASNVDGVITFPLDINFDKKIKPRLVFNKFYVNQKEISFNNFKEFDHLHNFIDIDFSLIDYKGIEFTKVYYSINDNNWIQLNSQKLSLNSLEPGSYTIKLKAVNERGIQSEKNLIFHFSITPPYYRSWWFILLMILLIVIIMFLGFKYRIGVVNKKNKLQTEKIELEKALLISSLTSIKSQMNPHFIFNSLNTIQSFIYTNEKEIASSYLVDFSELTRKILEMSNQSTVVLSEELEALKLYLKLEKMRFEEDFEYEIDTKSLPHESFRIPSMLIQPYVENAIKHGLMPKKYDKKIKLEFLLNSDLLIVKISDNGIGIAASKIRNANNNSNHKSFATIANQKRFDLLNQLFEGQIGVEFIELKDELDFVCGTQVILSIPIVYM